MHKRQLTEMQLMGAFFPALFFAFFTVLGHLTLTILLIATVSIVVFAIILPIWALLHSYRVGKVHGSGSKSFYNPLIKMVELHVGRTTSETSMLKIVLNAKRVAKRMNVDIIFTTNLYPAERLKGAFGDKIEIRKASFSEKVMFYIPYLLVLVGVRKRPQMYPLIRCVIHTRSL